MVVLAIFLRLLRCGHVLAWLVVAMLAAEPSVSGAVEWDAPADCPPADAVARRLERMLQELSEGRHERLEALFRDRLGLVGQRVVVTTATSETGVLTEVDFARVQLDGGRTHPLAIVRGIQRAP